VLEGAGDLQDRAAIVPMLGVLIMYRWWCQICFWRLSFFKRLVKILLSDFLAHDCVSPLKSFMEGELSVLYYDAGSRLLLTKYQFINLFVWLFHAASSQFV